MPKVKNNPRKTVATDTGAFEVTLKHKDRDKPLSLLFISGSQGGFRRDISAVIDPGTGKPLILADQIC